MATTTSSERFLRVQARLRSTLVCSLLIFAHCLLTTTATAPRELYDTYPTLAQSIKTASCIAFLTLLWQAFIFFEIAEYVKSPRPSYLESGEEDADQEGVTLFSMTGVEALMGIIALGGWTFGLDQSLLVFKVFSPYESYQLALLPIAFFLAFTCILVSELHIASTMLINYANGGLQSGWYMTRTGHWDGRVKLDEESMLLINTEKV